MPGAEQAREWIEKTLPAETPDREDVVESLVNYHEIVLHHGRDEQVSQGFADPMLHSVANEAEEAPGRPMVNRLRHLHRRQKHHTL